MKLLVTGGCGFLGSNIASSYLQDGVEVVIIDAMFRTGCAENLMWLRSLAKSENQLRHYGLDVADRKGVIEVFQKEGPFDYVCHLAGQVAMTTSLQDPHRDFLTNAMGTLNVLEAVRAFSPDALVAFSSTNKVYGDLTHLRYRETDTRYELLDFPNGLDESTPLDFASPYGCSKGCADQYIRDWSRNYGLKTVVFRHSSIFGGRQFSSFDQGWIGWFCKQAKDQLKVSWNGEPFTISGTGKQVRDVLHASDLIRLYRIAHDRQDDSIGEIFNIGGGQENSISIIELLNILQKKLSLTKGLAYRTVERRKSDQDVFIADISKAKRLIGWVPQMDCDTGIEQMLHWIQDAGL
jgi:CDP-paratose 2-epimerase